MSEPSLRELSLSDFHFWRDSPSEQFSLTVTDQKSDGNTRALPKNEIIAMALNEIAVRCGRGFFFHLLSRRGWTPKLPGEGICPSGRLSPKPGAQFPSLLYIDHVWTEESRRAYHNTSHRSRYLLCDGFINAPYYGSLYAIQYITELKIAVYATPSETLIILANSSTYYFFRSSELEDFVGRWTKKPLPQGPDPELRLRTTPYIWEKDASKISKGDHEILKGMQEHQVPDLQKLYDNIVQRCCPEKLAPTFTTSEFRNTIPRPPVPDVGISLGTPLRLDDEDQAKDTAQRLPGVVSMAPSVVINDSSNPPSRKGGRLRRDGTGQKRGVKRDRRKRSEKMDTDIDGDNELSEA